MPIKAVYSSDSLCIYITGGHVDLALTQEAVASPIFADKLLIAQYGVEVSLTDDGMSALRPFIKAYRETMRPGQPAFPAHQPFTQKGDQHGKKK
jgi:hypothetical protein